jgi:hypothetical protein
MDPDLFMKVADIAEANGVRPELALAQMRQESSGNANAVSNKGAQGLFQLMPATAKDLGVTDPFNQDQNINAGIKYLSQQLKANKGDESLALAAYNAGPGAVKKYHGIPPYKETQDYVKRILAKAGPVQANLAPPQNPVIPGITDHGIPNDGVPAMSDMKLNAPLSMKEAIMNHGTPEGGVPSMAASKLFAPLPPTPPPSLGVQSGLPKDFLGGPPPMDPDVFMQMMDRNEAIQKSVTGPSEPVYDNPLSKFLAGAISGVKDTVMHPIDNAPTLGGALGGVVGGIGGTAFGMGVGGAPGAIGGAALGGGAGEALKQLYNRFTGQGDAPASSLDAALGIGKNAAEQGAYETVGQGAAMAGSALKGAAKGVYKATLKSPDAAVKATEAFRLGKGKAAGASEIAETALRENLPVSQKGVEKAWQRIGGIDASVQDALAASGKTADQNAVVQGLRDAIKPGGSATMSGTPQETIGAYQKTLDDFLNHPNYQTTKNVPQQVQQMVAQQVPTGAMTAGNQPIMQTQMVPQMQTIMKQVVGRKPIPIEELHQLKKGTYAGLRGKYGPQAVPGSVEADIELGRGMRKATVDAVPQIGPAMAREGKLIPAAMSLDAAAKRIGNNNHLSIMDPLILTAGAGAGGAAGGGEGAGEGALGTAAALALLRKPTASAFLARRAYGAGSKISSTIGKALSKGVGETARFTNANHHPEDDEKALIKKAFDSIRGRR